MVARYAPRIKCRPGRGAVTLFEDQVVVSAPIDYGYANWFQDPTTKAGYVHAFLRPFRAVVAELSPLRRLPFYLFLVNGPRLGVVGGGAPSVFLHPEGGVQFDLFPPGQGPDRGAA